MTADGSGAPLRFATFLAPNMLPLYRFLAERIARRLGRPVELVVGVSFDPFERGEVDLGVICGLPYVWLAARQPRPVEPLAAPVLVGDRYAGRPVYYSDVIVRRDSPITCLEELRGCSWAYNEPASHSGHTATLYALVRMGARPGFFARVVEAGFHQQAIRLVHGGAVDAAAIDSQVLAVELRGHRLHGFVSHLERVLQDQRIDGPGFEIIDQVRAGVEADQHNLARLSFLLYSLDRADGRRLVGCEHTV